MSLYSKKDLSAVRHYVSGIELEPRVAAKEFVLSGEFPSPSAPCKTDLDSLLEDPQLAAARWHDGQFDARFGLVGTYEGGRKVVTTVGRKWDASSPGAKITFSRSGPWGDTPVALVPAVAGLASSVVEAGTVTSWSTLHTLLGANPAGVPVDRGLLTDLNRLQGGKVNTVRFVHRLAALFWHSVMSDGGRPVDVEIRSPARAVCINSVSALSAEIQQGLTGAQYVPWSSPAYADSMSVCNVLWAAAAGKLSTINGKKTRFLGYWPGMGRQVAVNVDALEISRALVNTARVTIDPSMVWFASVRWCARYSNVELFEEAVRFLGALMMSPCGGIMPVMDSKAQLGLPEASMGLFAAGAILQPILDIGIGNAPALPDIARMVEKAVVMSMLLGLFAWHDLWRVVGWYYRHGLTNDADAAEYCRRFQRHSDQVGAWGSVNSNMQQFAAGDLGRLWSRLAPVTTRRWAQTSGWGARAPQWEEILNRTRSIPSASGAYGTLMPLLLDRKSVDYKAWARASSVPSGLSVDYVFFGLSVVAPSARFKIRLERGLTSTFSELHLAHSYRGVVGDFAFQSGVSRVGADFEPVFALPDRRDFYRATDASSPRFSYRWFIESANEDMDERVALSASLEPVSVPTAVTMGPVIDDDYLESEGSVDDAASVFSVSSVGDAGEGPSGTGGADVAAEPQLPMGVESDSPLGEALLASHVDDERGTELYKRGLRYDQMLRAGIPVPLVSAYASLRTLGLPPPGMSTMEDELAQLKKHQAFEVLQGVPRNKRILALDWMVGEQLAVLKECPPSSSQVEIAKVLRGLYAMRNAMGTNTALTAEEHWDSLNRVEREGLGLRDGSGRIVSSDRMSLPTIARGRIANDQMSKELLYAGQPLLCGIGARLTTASLAAREMPELALNSVDELLETIIRSAWDAGEEPDREMLVELCGKASQVDTLLKKLNEARALEKSGFRVGSPEEAPPPPFEESQSGRHVAGGPSEPAPAVEGHPPVTTHKKKEKWVSRSAERRRSSVSAQAASADVALPSSAEAVDTSATRSYVSVVVGTDADTKSALGVVSDRPPVRSATAAPAEVIVPSPISSSPAGRRAGSQASMEDIGPVREAVFTDPMAGKRGSGL